MKESRATMEAIIRKLDLKPLPSEGGYYRETYRSQRGLPTGALGMAVGGKRNLATAIYYLVGPDDFSALHRVRSDEMFHFYAGDPVEMVQLSPDGKFSKVVLGSDVMNDEEPQVLVPAEVWQGTRLVQGGKWALLGTTVTPGFDFSDFDLADREVLRSVSPEHADEIAAYIR